MRMRLLRDWDAICEEGGRKEDTWIGGDGRGCEFSTRIITIVERNI